MDDGIEFDSESEQDHSATAQKQRQRQHQAQGQGQGQGQGQRRHEKRPVWEDDFEDAEGMDDYNRDARDSRNARTGNGVASSSKTIKATTPYSSVATAGSRRVREDDDEEDEKLTFRPDALQLSAEYLRLFTIEALHRTAAYQREQEDEELKNEETLIELDSLEAITPQLIMDF
ncbi:hypothetical protein BGZ58_008078 [Dissophora ornata]|nr:hypothetical protein BGZ58_008078 [Dissophora ornata]